MIKEQWLQDLKAGDLVIIARYGYRTQSRAILKITRTTPTLILIGEKPNQDKYTRSRGVPPGKSEDRSRRSRLQEPTPEALAQVVAENLKKRLSCTLSVENWSTHSLKTLEAVAIAAGLHKEENHD
ncbi:MAG: hypothetical protein JRD89_01565 [Deltaproteobacteria bacterium]|nr:hypothetical protein [Deltaproteobacteria bacterium]